MTTETDSTPYRQTEEALQESEAFNHSVFESSADCIKVLDLDGYLLSMNGPGRCLMEVEDCTPLIGTAWVEFWQGGDRATAKQALQTAKAGGMSRFSGYCSTAKGTPKWWDVVVSPVLDILGKPKRLLVISRDVSERKRAEDERKHIEAALQESEARLRFMLDSTQIGEWDLDLTTQPYTAHRSLRHDQIFGYESLLPEWNYDIFLAHMHPDDRAAVNETFQQTLSANTDWNFECRIIQVDQSVRWIWARSSVYCDSEGTPTRLLGVVMDITDRKQAEQRLRESEEQSRNLLESITDAFFAVDEHWRFTYVNQTAGTLVARSPADLIGKIFWEEFPGVNDSEFERMHRRVMRDRIAESLTEFYPDHDRWYEVRTYPAVNGVTMYFRNVTDQIQAEVALRRSEARFRRIFECEMVPMAVWTTTGDITEANDALLNIIGYTR